MKKTWIIVAVVAVILLGAVAVYARPFNTGSQQYEDAWLSDRAEWLDEQVKEGNLTREEADAMLEFMEERMDDGYCVGRDDDSYYGRYAERGFGRGGMFGGCFR